MEQDQSPVNVTVSGSDGLTVRAVTGVMANALQQSGFENVRVGTLDAEPDPLPDGSTDAPSLLDLVRAQRPHLYRTPINVTHLTLEPARQQSAADMVLEAATAAVAAVGPDVQVHAVFEVGSGATFSAVELATEQVMQRAQEIVAEGVGLSTAQEEEQELDVNAMLAEAPEPPTIDSEADQQLAADLERDRTET